MSGNHVAVQPADAATYDRSAAMATHDPSADGCARHPHREPRLDACRQAQRCGGPVCAPTGGGLVTSLIDGMGPELVRAIAKALVIHMRDQLRAFASGRETVPGRGTRGAHLDLSAGDAGVTVECVDRYTQRVGRVRRLERQLGRLRVEAQRGRDHGALPRAGYPPHPRARRTAGNRRERAWRGRAAGRCPVRLRDLAPHSWFRSCRASSARARSARQSEPAPATSRRSCSSAAKRRRRRPAGPRDPAGCCRCTRLG